MASQQEFSTTTTYTTPTAVQNYGTEEQEQQETTQRRVVYSSTSSRKRLLWFVIAVAILLELYFFARGGLLVVQYATPGKVCSRNNNSSQNHQKAFTAIMYGICAVLRCLEYILLANGFRNFVSTVDSHSYKKELRHIVVHVFRKLNTFWGCVFLLLIPSLLLLSVAIPIFGILLEIEYSQTTECREHNSSIFIAYCAFNIGRYLFASCVRLTMAVAAIKVGRIWCVIAPDPASSADAEQPNRNENFLGDWKVISNEHNELSTQYEQRGQKSEIICEIFKTWFIVPWITYFIATSIKTKHVLGPWLQDEEETEVERKLLPAIYYMLYNVFQVISLLVAYISGLKMNTYHQVYYASLRKIQLSPHRNHSQHALARIMHIEKKEQYDFVPHVAFTHIKIQMDNPLYVIFLLLGIFFTVCGALL